MSKEQADRQHDRHDEFVQRTNEAAIAGAESTLKAMLLINGGAAVSVLAFIGGLAAKVNISELASMANSLVWFGVGVAVSTLTSGLAYLTNYFIALARVSLMMKGGRCANARMSQPKKIVLVIDDEFGVVEFLNFALEDVGHRVAVAPNGKVGLALAQAECPDLILLDFIMPVMDGPATLKGLQMIDELRHVPIIMMSAIDEAAVRAHSRWLRGVLAQAIPSRRNAASCR